MKIGFTGTREGMSDNQIVQFVELLNKYQPTEFHHGDCLGADLEAHVIVQEYFKTCKIHVHPPENNYLRAFCKGDIQYDPLGYIKRDRNIVDYTELLIATPLTDKEVMRSGTWATIRYAKQTNKPIQIIQR